ncbi:bifunctional glycosyltransferase family 2 protein/CDP-glycerol:glycerophosphate glycerophosphotransferase [Streptomyces sp. NBC_00094]|uniref:bifunctional glycosyltransferase/CDP-glycerol:glycerophosphate glycerophosphotransferase n=1 Tax=Streptomyces sp. NBC_00094 TaxID=2903620 RepID=UPI00225732EB|nr:bifunctional glycosyltransferase family 2 protein/CDP-glycerol:glycerophosphate glycerophosphotransferase [Streptomyces sp. NBC_00094]MCX5390683.1 bifunctional glycosyltransferase family 2 protein/CDP-glycerol:glycerophosphate glycerophosphotransferase [Streptomyces sp. NBC_00094]
MPDVSVIVIAYNDAERLPAAVQSVLDQTLKSVEVLIVDDCSSDDTFSVAQSLAAAHPDLVRAYQLPENSGAGGEPRNVGIGHARGRYVMFLDSDDVLELNACLNMVAAADETEADMVSGLCVRLHKDTANQKRDEWYSWIYRQTRTLNSVAELPDLFVWDTLSTNKCYRREFLLENNLRFPKGMFYEDLMFIAEAYLAAKKITLIPNQVYFWHVHQNAQVKSVTNRRHEMTNYIHRLEIHRRIDALLDEHGLPELRHAKDVKFLKHDLVLHLRDLPFRDESFRREFAELSRDYLQGLDREAYPKAQPIQSICAYLLEKGDWDNLLPAVDTLLHRDKVSTPLHEEDERIYWCAEHLDDEFGRSVLDVTDRGYHKKPINKLFLRNELTSYEESGGTVRLSGRINNPLGVITPEAHLTGGLEFRARRRSLQTFVFPVKTLRHDGESIHWEAEIDLGSGLRPLGIIDSVWDVRLDLDVDGKRTRTRLTVGTPDLGGEAFPIKPRLTRLVADRIEPHATAKGHLAFRLVSTRHNSERIEELILRGVRGTPGKLAKSGYRKAKALRKTLKAKGSKEKKLDLYYEAYSRLPVKKRTVVFESHLGKQYSDSPRAIYEEMRRQGLDFEAIWSYAGTPTGFPEDAELVRRWSVPYLKALARAEFWVDNQSFPLRLAKRPETTYIQTWHGSALKKMGFDQPALKAKTRAQRAADQKHLNRFDHFLVRTEHDVRTLARAFNLKDEVLLRSGYPRNDTLVQARLAEEETGTRVRGPVAEELGIPADKTVLLYAPTFRTMGKASRFSLPFDVEAFAEEFGDRYVLLVRAHYLNHVVLPPTVEGKVIDVSKYHDVMPLMELSDALITDYSSVMFDYALLDRPMLFFTYDYERYVHEDRGTYFDLLEKAPGPVFRTEDEFLEEVRNLEAQGRQYADVRKCFVAEFGEYDHGNAAKTIVDQFFSSRWSR